MNSVFRNAIAYLVSLLVGFVYGVLVMYREWFPYEQLQKIKRQFASSNVYEHNENNTYGVIEKLERNADFEVHIPNLDESQNHAIFIQSADGSNVLLDCGHEEPSEYLVGYLRQLGIDTLDYVAITMYDADHTGGLERILDAFDVETVALERRTSRRNIETKQDIEEMLGATELLYPTVGDEIPIDGSLQLKKIGPERTYTRDNCELSKPDRCNSTVYKLVAPEFDALFMSDAQLPAENDMLDGSHDLSAEFLLVGHHGVGPVNSFDFLDAVAPNAVVIDGYGSPPIPYQNRGRNDDRIACRSKLQYLEHADIYETGRLGSMVVQVTDSGYNIKTSV